MPRRSTLDVEIIEVLDPDDRTLLWPGAGFGPPPTAPRGDEPRTAGRRRAWIVGGLAALTATAAVVTMVLQSDPADRPHRAPSAPLAVGRYIPTGPTVVLQSAELVTRVASPDTFRMWADDAHPGGAWVWVEVRRPHGAPTAMRDATARTIDDVRFAVLDDAQQLLAATRDFGAGWVGDVRLRGIDGVAAAAIVERLHLGLTYSGDAVVELDDARIAGLNLRPVVAADLAATALFGTVTSEVHARSRDVDYTLRVADGDLASRVENLRFLSRGPITLVDGVAVGTLWDGGDAVALWADGDHLLSVTAHTDTMTVAALADSVRVATVPEWTAATETLAVATSLGPAQSLASGSDTRGGWTAGVQAVHRPGGDALQWWASAPGDRSQVVTVASTPLTLGGVAGGMHDREVDRVVVDGVTYVFVQARRLGGVDHAEVTVDDTHAVDLPLVPLQGNARVLVGAARLDRDGSVRVILGIAPGG